MKAKNTSLAPSTAVALQPGDLVNEHEAAAIIGGEVGTLRNWRSLGKGPHYYKIGERMVRYHRADLAAFIGSQMHSGEAR
jgi:hypothetical protein